MANIYLCVKQHSITGKKYFCKTTSRDPYKYPGSGVGWKQHWKENGAKHIITLNVWEFNNKKEAKTFALNFSEENNIVESEDWLNRINENGSGGGRPKGYKHTEKTIEKMKKPKSHTENMGKYIRTNEWREAKSKQIKESNFVPWNKNKTGIYSEETLKAMGNWERTQEWSTKQSKSQKEKVICRISDRKEFTTNIWNRDIAISELERIKR